MPESIPITRSHCSMKGDGLRERKPADEIGRTRNPVTGGMPRFRLVIRAELNHVGVEFGLQSRRQNFPGRGRPHLDVPRRAGMQPIPAVRSIAMKGCRLRSRFAWSARRTR